MNPCAIITARGGSKGIPNKNVMYFCGRSLIAWSIHQAIAAKLPTYVTTEDRKIAEVAKFYGAEVIDRPVELAQDNSTTVDCLKHAVDYLFKKGKLYDTIVLLQPTSPLRIPTDIRECLKLYEYSETKYLMCGYEDVILEWKQDSPDARFKANSRRQDIEPKIIQHGMIYIYNTLYEPLGPGYTCYYDVNVYITPKWQSYELDTPEDIDICEYYMRKKILCTT